MLKAQFDNTYHRLGEKFFEENSPQKVTDPKLLRFNSELAQQLGISFDLDQPDEIAKVFSGNLKLEGAQPLSQAYAGHQFGNFVPQLGDGRAHLLGELVDKNGLRFDVQLKGSGTSRFSRQG
ncbi:MAG: YdiU family protein, partial [Bdellovibrionales bacterium]|nr:YdiU family protein [Bdellovibrionales bacterium]